MEHPESNGGSARPAGAPGMGQPAGGYAWDAADYARHSSGQYAWAQERLGKLALVPDERVLDIGCGDGKITAAIAGLLPRGYAVGLDFSLAMVRLACAHHPPSAYHNLSFLQMDARRLGFAGKFDVAFSNATLHWVHDHPAVLHGVAAALRPGGRAIFEMGGRGNAPDMFALLDEMLAAEPWQRYFVDFLFPYGFYGPEEYQIWLPQAGLVPIRLELVPKDMRHAGRDGLAGWVRTTWLPYTQRVPEDRRPAFVNEVVERYLARSPADGEGVVHVRMVRLEVEAVKRDQ